MHPAILRLFLCFFLVSTDVFFLVVIVKVGEETSTSRYLCKNDTTLSHDDRNGTCWNWDFGSTDKSCMFTLLFAATICLHLAIFAAFTSSVVKCLFPEFAFAAQRSPFLSCISRYLLVALSFAGCILSSSLLVYVLVRDSKSSSSCFKTGHLWWNCKKNSDNCYVFALLATGCGFSLLSVFLSACDARLMHIGKKDFEEEERIYQIYVDYHAVRDLDSY